VQQVWEAAERIGYPLIVKPIAGAGSADTYRVDSPAELAEVLPMVRHVEVLSVEEFIEAEEFTYDTVFGAGTSCSRTSAGTGRDRYRRAATSGSAR
jgi:biotin carboxylase